MSAREVKTSKIKTNSTSEVEILNLIQLLALDYSYVIITSLVASMTICQFYGILKLLQKKSYFYYQQIFVSG